MNDHADWPVGFDSSREDQARMWARATAAQRLAWLEDAVRLALRTGALRPGEAAGDPGAKAGRSDP